MSILALTSDTLIGTAAAGNLEYNGQFFGTDSNASRAQLQRIVRATAVASTSGTSIDFTGIPAWCKKITVMFSAVSTSGTSLPQIQLGDSGGVETTGYVSLASGLSTNANSTTGLLISSAGNAGYVFTGSIVIMNISGTSYVSSAVITTDSSLGGTTITSAGRKTLSDTLDRLRITTVNGTDTFDAGTINIMYEG